MTTPFAPILPPAPDVSTPLLRGRIRALFQQVPKGLAGGEDAIHQMRVAGRRLRVALPQLSRRPEGARARRALRVLRQLTRTAGVSRDLDVIAALLGEWLEQDAQVTPDSLALERRLLAARRRSRGRMAEALLDLEIARLRRDLRAIVRRQGEDVFTALARLHQERDQRGARLLEDMAALGERFDVARLHGLRKSARKLRYTAEILGELRQRPAEAADLFRELQAKLGDIHDRHVLANWLAHQAELAEPRGLTALASEARRLEAVFHQRSLEAHQGFLRASPRDSIERALDAMGRARFVA